MEEIHEIESKDICFQNFKIDEIKEKIVQCYSQEVFYYLYKLNFKKNQFIFNQSRELNSGTVSKDFKTLVTGGTDSVIRVWNVDMIRQKFLKVGHK